MTKVAFQGGGAKLGELLAVATAIKSSSINPSEFAGTSAGALVASVLACDRDPRLVVEFLKNNEKYIRQQFGFGSPNRLLFSIFYSIISGKSLISSKKLREVFEKCFDYIKIDQNTRICETKFPINIVSADLISKKPKIFSKDDLLIDALIKSCSLPFIFTSFRSDDSHIVDGGLFANLPIEVLQKDKQDTTNIIAVSFEQDYEFKNENVISYVMGLVSSMIDARTIDNVSSVGLENVYPIETSVRSFSIDDLFEFIKKEKFDIRVSHASKWIARWRRGEMAQYSDYQRVHKHLPSYAQYISSKVQNLGSMFLEECNDKLSFLSLDVIPSINEEDDGYDAVNAEFVISADPQFSRICYMCHAITSQDRIELISADWKVVDDQGRVVPHIAVPVPQGIGKGTEIYIFFGRRLGGRDGYQGSYRVFQRQIIKNLMSDLNEGRADWFIVTISEKEEVENFELRLHTKLGLGGITQRAGTENCPGAASKSVLAIPGRNSLVWAARSLKSGDRIRIDYMPVGSTVHY